MRPIVPVIGYITNNWCVTDECSKERKRAILTDLGVFLLFMPAISPILPCRWYLHH